MNSTPQNAAPTAAPRLAYLLSQHPAVSHTFVFDEIANLRSLGFHIETASINPPSTSRPLTAAEVAAAAETLYIKHTPLLRVTSVFCSTLFTRPAVFFRGLLAALTGVPFDARRLLYALFYFGESLLVARWLQDRGLRHLHMHFGGAVATVGRIAARAAHVPYSITIHGPDEFFDERRFLLDRKVADAAFILCISDFCRGQLMRIADPLHWPRLHVTRLGCDTVRFAARTPRAIAMPVQMLCVGRLVPAKGQRVLLEACALLARRGHPLHITLVGDGPDAPALRAFAESSGLAASVHFTGSLTHDETRARLAEADVFVLPSFAEGIPVALMEAMATQLAVVSTYVAGIPELITHNADGLLVPCGSVTALADALELLLVDSQLRARLGLAARQRVLAAYDQATNTAHAAELLRTLLSS